MAKVGAKPGTKVHHIEETRRRIRVSMLVTKLHDFIEGKVEMSMGQIRAAEILLRKAVPDLKQVEHTGEIRHQHVSELTDDQLLAIAAGRSAGIVDEAESEGESSGVH